MQHDNLFETLSLESWAAQHAERERRRTQDELALYRIWEQILITLLAILMVIHAREAARAGRRERGLVRQIRCLKGAQFDPGADTARVLLKLQEQRLHLALARVRSDLRADYRLALFPGPERIRRVGARLRDEDFKVLCAAVAALHDAPGFEAEAARLYHLVLQRAGMHDPDRTATVRRLHGPVAHPGAQPGSKISAAAPITDPLDPSLRGQLRTSSRELAAALRQEGASLQVRLLRDLQREALADPLRLDLTAAEQELVAQLLGAPTAANRSRLAAAIYESVLNRWKEQFAADGYPLKVFGSMYSFRSK